MRFVSASDERGVTLNGLGLQRYEWPGGAELLGHLGTTAAGCCAFVGQLPDQRIDIALVITNPGDPSPLLSAVQLMADEAS
jgi:hypothetical protein